MREQDERVPAAVEEYLIGLYAAAGSVGGRLGGGSAGARGGAHGGARGARRLKTVVEERAGVLSGTPDQLRQRVSDAIPELQALPSEPSLWRVAIPIGRMGLQQVIVDLSLTPRAESKPRTDVRLLAFCKEGLLHRKLTAKTADRVWAALA